MSNQTRDNILGGVLLATGLIVGAAAALFVKQNQPLNAGLVLKEIKADFAKEGTIEGSWIDYDAIEYPVYTSKPLVYMGGITRNEADRKAYYQFAADIYTGEVLDVYEVNRENFANSVDQN
ncbi:hypothetical protein [Eremococcus coleocola]|uniref:hypothetical protein n=1 Tax=Eremococcus coleocola TaxID=88132 RepID=UPI00041257CF|nr:hypothetical protein [Eremococcus coleocola]